MGEGGIGGQQGGGEVELLMLAVTSAASASDEGRADRNGAAEVSSSRRLGGLSGGAMWGSALEGWGHVKPPQRQSGRLSHAIAFCVSCATHSGLLLLVAVIGLDSLLSPLTSSIMAEIIDDKSEHCIPFILERIAARRKRYEEKGEQVPPFFLGLNGVQGAGKTTLVGSCILCLVCLSHATSQYPSCQPHHLKVLCMHPGGEKWFLGSSGLCLSCNSARN